MISFNLHDRYKIDCVVYQGSVSERCCDVQTLGLGLQDLKNQKAKQTSQTNYFLRYSWRKVTPSNGRCCLTYTLKTKQAVHMEQKV